MYFLYEIINGFSPKEKGFIFMWGLAALAVAAIFLIIERWLDIRRRMDVNAPLFTEKIRDLILRKRLKEAYALCRAGGDRALGRIFAAGIKRSVSSPALVKTTMEAEFLRAIPAMDKRLNLILMVGNTSTMLGLMGTIFGLIIAFTAISEPGVAAVEKSAMLAAGISTAMNTTLVGLIISIPSILAFSMLRTRVDRAIKELDRYSLPILRILVPGDAVQTDYRFSGKRIKEEIDTEPNIGPMMSLIVILIPLLLTSAEFVKIGAIELFLPTPSSKESPVEKKEEKKEEQNLNLKIEILETGIKITHSLQKGESMVIPKAKGDYDIELLKKSLADVKKAALVSMINPEHREEAGALSLSDLFSRYLLVRDEARALGLMKDLEVVQISGQGETGYQTIVSVIDAARETKVGQETVSLFPDVELAMKVEE